MKTIRTRKLVESAMLIALGTVLSLVKIDMPMGGGVTLGSMLPLVVVSHRWGWKWGTVTAFVYSLLQLMLGLDNVRYASSFVMAVGIVLLDYIVAYTVIGLSGLAERFVKSRRGALAAGIAVSFALRFACHFVTGAWIWDALWPNEFGMAAVVYSLVYNGWYMAAELGISLIAAMLMYGPLGRFFRGEDLG